MENSSRIGENTLSLTLQMPDLFKEEVIDRLNTIYNEILEIEQEDSSIKFNRNISFINRLHREDPIIVQALKCIYVADSILKNRILSKKEILKIAVEYTKLKKEQMLMLDQLDHIEDILKMALHIDVFYKAMAATSYYDQFQKGKVIETAFGVYEIITVIEKKEGLRVLYFEPKSNNEGRLISPILSVRGTVVGHVGNTLDNLHPSIGQMSFEAGRDDLFNLLQESFQKFPQGCVVLGHSLGGAIAQHIAAAFVKYGFISQVYHYNAPGIGALVTAQFIKDLESADSVPDIIEVRHKKDLLSYFGGSHLPSTHRVFIEYKEKVTCGVAHEILTLMEKAQEESLEVQILKAPEELQFWAGRYNYFSVETLRWAFGPILSIMVNILFPSKPEVSSESCTVEEISEENLFIEKHNL